MKKAFEKILEFIDEQIKIEESIAKSKKELHPITHQYGANCMNVIKKFVQEAAEEYNGVWIACSERLPEYDEEYYKKNGTHRRYIVMEKEAYAPSVAYYTKDKLWFYDDMIEFKNVVAWQPLPEPYKESD